MTDSAEVVRLRARVVALRKNRALARHATKTALAAVALDGLYTAVFWLVLGRDERRTKRHAELRYFGIIFQLAAEAALIAWLIGQLRKVQQ